MTHGFRARFRELIQHRPLQVLTAAILVAASAAAATPLRHGEPGEPRSLLDAAVVRAQAGALQTPEKTLELVWDGADVDGDGRADFANPTGQEARGHDAYGYGEFGTRRDGGARRHEGVDFVADAGQEVVAPISGFVTKIGYAYAGDQDLRFVEITNPALHRTARVFYVRPTVDVGDAVAVGRPIGRARTLQDKYPAGMTDHVHLELMDHVGRRFDAAEVLTERYASAD